MLETRSHADGQYLDKRTLLRGGRGHPVGLYAPLLMTGLTILRHVHQPHDCCGCFRPLLLSVIELSAFIDAFRSCPLGLHRLASAKSGAHWGLAMRATRIATLVVAQEQCGIYPVTEAKAMEAARHS